jgi:hypothetical protein
MGERALEERIGVESVSLSVVIREGRIGEGVVQPRREGSTRDQRCAEEPDRGLDRGLASDEHHGEVASILDPSWAVMARLMERGLRKSRDDSCP